MPIEVSIHTSPDQDTRLESLLATMNEQLIAQGMPPFADVNDMSRDALVKQLRGWEKMADSAVVEQFKGLFELASNVQRQQVIDILLPPEDV